jgi:hypothetical protein
MTFMYPSLAAEFRATRPQPFMRALCAVLWVVACYAWWSL